MRKPLILFFGALGLHTLAMADLEFRVWDSRDTELPTHPAQLAREFQSAVQLITSAQQEYLESNRIMSVDEAEREKKSRDTLPDYVYRFQLIDPVTGKTDEYLSIDKVLFLDEKRKVRFQPSVPATFLISIRPTKVPQNPISSTRHQLVFKVFDAKCSIQYGERLDDERCSAYQMVVQDQSLSWSSKDTQIDASSKGAVDEVPNYPMISNRPFALDPPLNVPRSKWPICPSTGCKFDEVQF